MCEHACTRRTHDKILSVLSLVVVNRSNERSTQYLVVSEPMNEDSLWCPVCQQQLRKYDVGYRLYRADYEWGVIDHFGIRMPLK